MIMKAVVAEKPGDESVLKLAEVSDPMLRDEDILMQPIISDSFIRQAEEFA